MNLPSVELIARWLLIVGAANWGWTAARLIADGEDRSQPRDLLQSVFSAVGMGEDGVNVVQLIVYLLVVLSAAYLVYKFPSSTSPGC